MKTCTKCHVEKELTEFCVDKRQRMGRRPECSACTYAQRHDYNMTRGKSVKKATHLRTNYGMTLEHYEWLLDAQGGCCASCGRPNPGQRSLHVDHCHTTGKIRGLLCHHCNTAYGLLQESEELISRLLDYHRTHST